MTQGRFPAPTELQQANVEIARSEVSQADLQAFKALNLGQQPDHKGLSLNSTDTPDSTEGVYDDAGPPRQEEYGGELQCMIQDWLKTTQF